MPELDDLELLFIITAFSFQAVLITHFILRKWFFPFAIRYGPVVYALGGVAAWVSLLLLRNDRSWSFWLAGFLYLAWGVFGYWVEYIRKVEWRSPPRWPVLVPYLLLYLGTVLFYWFPLALLWKPLWYVYAVLFLISTWLNITSHAAPAELSGEG